MNDLTPVIDARWREYEARADDLLAARLSVWERKYPEVRVLLPGRAAEKLALSRALSHLAARLLAAGNELATPNVAQLAVH